MESLVDLGDGRLLPRDKAEAYLELLREQHRRREAARIRNERAAIIANCSTLYGFIKEFWFVLEPVAKFKGGWALMAMCDHLEAVTRGDIKRLLITVPPGMMKSLLMVFWTAWEWGPKGMPHIQVLATSYSQKNAFRDNQKLRDLVSSEKFQALWTVELRTDTNAISKFANTKSGWCEARPFSKMTGGRANRVKIDDPHDTEGAESPVQRKKTVKIMREAISDRLNDMVEDAIVLIMQRLHQGDCAAAAKEMGYVHLELPMEFELGRRCKTILRPANDGSPALIFEDPRQFEGELLFPERFPAATIAQLKKDKGAYAWAGQYQQRPAPREGGMFERGWFKRVGALPLNATRFVRAWDFAASEGDTADYSASIKITRDGHDGAFILVHGRRGRWSPGRVETEVKSTAEGDRAQHPGAITIRIPQDPGSSGKSYVRTLVKQLAGHAVKFEPVTGSKEVRAKALAVQAEVGNVYILETGDPVKDAWIEDFLDELEVFPAGANDDQVDAAADAFNELALAPPPLTVKRLRV
ncbi:MAG: phage terminase large subunit [Caulobacterales bacterium]|nr:phage terminase large subunit [Caulobacterales bacterium]